MKIVVRILIVGAIGVVLLLGGLWFFMGPIVRAGVERGGEAALGVPTPVADLRIQPLAGDVAVEGLAIHAPEGFQHREVLRVGSASLSVPVTNLRDDPLVVDRVAVGDLALVLERRDGVFNYEPLLAHVRERLGPRDERAEEPPPEPEGPSRTIHFREIAIEGVRLTVDILPGTLQPQTVTLAQHTIRDLEVGGDAEPFGELLGRLLDELVQLALTQGSGLLSGDLRREFESARAQLEERAAAELERVEGRAREALDEAAGKVEEALGGDDAARKAADEAKRKLDDLFGGKSDG